MTATRATDGAVPCAASALPAHCLSTPDRRPHLETASSPHGTTTTPHCQQNYGPSRRGCDGWRARGAERVRGSNGVTRAVASARQAASRLQSARVGVTHGNRARSRAGSDDHRPPHHAGRGRYRATSGQGCVAACATIPGRHGYVAEGAASPPVAPGRLGAGSHQQAVRGIRRRPPSTRRCQLRRSSRTHHQAFARPDLPASSWVSRQWEDN
jgi:hypothetical protein